MSEDIQASVGQVLRDARNAQGIALDEAAVRLRLMHRQIEAMETDDFDSLGQPVFARGFVRNYARLLGLAPDALLARMPGTPAEPAVSGPVNAAAKPLPRPGFWLTSPWLVLVLLGLLLVVVLPVALYWWLNSEEDDAASLRTQPVNAQPAPVSAPAPALSAAVAPAAPAAPVAAVAPPAAVEAVAPAAPAVRSVVHLDFGGDAWVEIRDANGRMLLRKLNPAGSSVDVHGQPPFDVVVGNAAQTRMTYNGRPIDLKPFIDVTVARFTLEE